MPRFGSFTSARSVTISSRNKVPFIYSPISWYRGTTKYNSGYGLGTFSTINDALNTSVKKFGGKSLYIPYVDNTTRYYIDIPITDPGNEWLADMWFYLPTTNYGDNEHSFALFSLIDSVNNYIAGFYIYPPSWGNYWNFSTVTKNQTLGSNHAGQGGPDAIGNRKDEWKHIAISRRSDGATCLWVDGAPGNYAYAGTHRWAASYDKLRIGCFDSQTVDALKRGYIDHLHMTTGINRFGLTSSSINSITAPTSKPVATSNTVLLVNF